MHKFCNFALKSLTYSSLSTSHHCSHQVRVKYSLNVSSCPWCFFPSNVREFSGKSGKDNREKDDDDEWNEAWESVWIPEDTNKAPWEVNDNACSTSSWPDQPLEDDEQHHETKQFLHKINNKLNQMTNLMKQITEDQPKSSYYRLEEEKEKTEQKHLIKENPEDYIASKISKDYRVTKRRVHASLWLKEIEKQEEAKLGNPANDDIDQLLDNCSQFFDYTDHATRLSDDPNFKVFPEGWEGVTKDEKPWEISQKEEDILLQEFERRMAFNKIQIANFIKSHIFSRRRPIDGWKYMIEVIGPNAKNRKGANKFVNEASTHFDDKEKAIVKREPLGRRRRVD